MQTPSQHFSVWVSQHPSPQANSDSVQQVPDVWLHWLDGQQVTPPQQLFSSGQQLPLQGKRVC
jgi:hypothetical protein